MALFFKGAVGGLIKVLVTAIVMFIPTIFCAKHPDNTAGQFLEHLAQKVGGRALNQIIDSNAIFDSERYGALSKYTIDVTKQAQENKLKPVIGRENETDILIQTLTRKGKGNPCIIGEPGIGKTSIVEGLAMKIVNGDVPDELKNKQIISLDVAALIAGNSYTGNYMTRLRSLLEDLADSPNVILFFDEVHLLQKLGADLWKPILNNENIKIIGATTINEYRIIEEDDALVRRFQTIRLKQPTKEETIEIIKGIKNRIEEKSNVTITDEAIKSAVELSGRYMPTKNFPDKAIDVISQSASMVHSKEGEKYSGTDLKPTVKPEDVKTTVSNLTGIPIFPMSEKETVCWEIIKQKIKNEIIGQDKTIDKIIDSIIMARMGLTDQNHPISSLLFTGASGVGKTELCKVLAREAYGNPDALININMSRYVNASSVTELIGSYTGNKGILTDAVSKRPYSIVLLDEIEKADPSIVNLLLTAVDNGFLINGQGKKVDFSNTIIIMTTNSCNDLITNLNTDNIDEIKTNVTNKIKTTKYHEILNVVDELIVFNKLQKEDIINLTNKMINDLKSQYKEKNINIEFTEECINKIAEKGYDKEKGARALIRLMQSEIKNPIVKALINNNISNDKVIVCDYNNNGFSVNIASNNISK